MLNNKYELLPTETSLYHLRALKDFGDVKEGQLGGLVSGEYNLGIWDDSWIDNTSCATNGSIVRNNAQVINGSILTDRPLIEDNAIVDGSVLGSQVHLSGNAYVEDIRIDDASPHFSLNAHVTSSDGWCLFRGFGSDDQITTAFRQKDNSIAITCRYFRGSLLKFAEHVETEYGDSQFGREYQKIIELIKIKFGG